MSTEKRKYETTHYWIKFMLDVREVSYKLWLLLGAAESKCQHLRGIPLRPSKQEELNQVSLRRGVRATTAIEGNMLHERDIEKIQRGEEAEMPRSRAYQVQEVKNMLEVYNGVASDLSKGKGNGVSLRQLLADNAVIMSGLELQEGEQPGTIRTYPVGVADYLGAPAEDCEYLLERLFEWLSLDWGMSSEHPIVEGILKAIIAHVYIAWIHPFGNGNGRGARVLEFRILMRAGVPFEAAHLLTSYYNETREEYYEKLKRSSRKENGEVEFIEYAVQGFVDGLDREIKSILEEQVKVTWESYVNEYFFKEKQTVALSRRRELLLEISENEQAMSLSDMKRRLPDKILKSYQGSVKMLSRDIKYLERMGLIHVVGEGYIASKEKMKAFIPLKELNN